MGIVRGGTAARGVEVVPASHGRGSGHRRKHLVVTMSTPQAARWAGVGKTTDRSHLVRTIIYSAIESTSRRVGEGNGAVSNGPRVSEAVDVIDHVRLC